ncbi:arabinosyltransferase C [Prauserella shujinwangii]|uniref:Arabinosyltransferase C n=1 Tax=Prauserella shujinwangii TaxID=1453103 RepID=A0A2T0LW19_9PSEU|nr:arabinosyltransferase domain-containing protein [Prauserella shujinwangii]PRX48225.1 arabinosyltransferase C [Prauserella shujinwangii]
MRLGTSTRSAVPEPASPSAVAATGGRTERHRLARRLTVVLGLLAAACALAFPFLPVVQDTARITWPVGGDTGQVNAPLAGYWAQDLRADLPCATVRSADARTPGPALLFSTVPAPRAEDGAGLQLQVDDGLLLASNRGEQIARQPLPATGCDVAFHSTATRTTLAVGGIPVFDAGDDVRPRVIGIYSGIEGGKDPTAGLSVSITPDTRYQSSPTVLKVAVSVLGALALAGCLFAVNRLDAGVARRAPRWAPIGWWRLTGRDLTVFAALGAWVFIGPVTSDDGYILTMSRVAEEAGYLTNYHRWFGVAEAPFGWFYHVYQLMTHVSVAPPWIRLPSFLLGVLSWLLISREVLPRLGKEVRTSRAAGWAAATVFLVWWMPFNNGVRPEPVAAVGSLLALCAVERALVTRRLLPLCLGLLAAAFTLAATPTGLIAVAPFLVAARPLFQLLRQRARPGGWVPVLAPIVASGLLVLFVVFADQTFATVSDATRLRNQVGPSLSWFEELKRYELLFSPSPDGSATRRFPVLLLILCTGTCLVVLLRRGRIPGAALGPSRRLIATVALFFLLLALTPTKWTHHFGAFAAVGAAMAALTALATSSSVLRSKRNRAAFVSGLLVVAALATTGPNAYWFVSKMGVPWYDIPPQLGGVALSTLLLAAAALAAVIAFVENVRAQRPGAPPPLPERRGLALWRGSVAIVVVCGLVAAFEFTSMAKAIAEQSGTYSLGAANVEQVFGGGCGLGDHVMVERDPIASVLTPLPAGRQRTVPERRETEQALPSAERGNGRIRAGFHTGASLTGDPLAEPPHGFTPGTVPMWSSYDETGNPTGRLRTEWFGLGRRSGGAQLVVAVAAPAAKATSVEVQYGEPTPGGFRITDSAPALAQGSGSGGWQDVRLRLDGVPEAATAVRVVATDDDLTEDGWVAATAPRVPTFTTLSEKVGDRPVYMDWPTSFVYPCLDPMKIRDGIAEVPAFRLTAGPLAPEANWASERGGGPLGYLEELADQPEVPSFLAGAPGRPWGTLLAVQPYAEGSPPRVVRGQQVLPGWRSPAPIPSQPGNT